MAHNRNMTSTDRVFWRKVVQATHDACREPTREGPVRALERALKGRERVAYPDLRPLPSGFFRGFLLMTVGFASEKDVQLRVNMADDMRRIADRAGDILDGIHLNDEQPSWLNRRDLL